jgi:hypothetical protein
MKFEIQNINVTYPKSSFLSHQIEANFRFNKGVKSTGDIFVSIILYVPLNKKDVSLEEVKSESLKTIENSILGKNSKFMSTFKVVTSENLSKPKLVFDINDTLIIN